MLGHLVLKDLRLLLLSPKYAATFGTCVVLLLLSVFVGIREYRAAEAQYVEARRMAEEALLEETAWFSLQHPVFRAPDPMQVFVAGTHNDVGRVAAVSAWDEVRLDRSPYMEDTLFALFRFIDLAFIVQVILTLFAVLFTYDAVSGERERGTLQLTFAGPVSRAGYLVAKFAGAWLGLVVPLLLPFALGLLMVLLYRVPLTEAHGWRLAVLFGYSLLLLTFFVALGVCVSAMTRRSSVSFLVLLMAWVGLVLIVPRVGGMVAGRILPVPTVAELESRKEGYARSRRTAFMEETRRQMEARRAILAGMTPDERRAYEEANEWAWMLEMDQAQKAMQADVAEYARKLNEEVRSRETAQERLAFTLARISPASAYQLAAMRLAGTDVGLKRRYEEALEAYQTQFARFVEAKGGGSGLVIRFGPPSDDEEEPGEPFDLGEMPRFEPPEPSFAESAAPTLFDGALLALCTLLAFAGAFVAFLRYDVRS